MRKVFAMILCFLMVFSSAAFADGIITISDHVLFAYEGYSSATGVFAAKIENTGDAPVAIGGGTLTVYDANEEIVHVKQYMASVPDDVIIQPGDYFYISENIYFEDGTAVEDVVTYAVEVPASNRGYGYIKLPCEAVVDTEDVSMFGATVDVTFTNTQDYVIYDYGAAVALYDNNGNLLYVSRMYSFDIGLHPNAIATLEVNLSIDALEYFLEKGIEIGSMDAYVFCEAE